MRYLLMLLSIATSLAFTACGSNNNTGSGTVTAVPAVGVGPTGTGVVIGSCSPGQIYHPTYGCMNRYSCNEGYGWVVGQNICVQGTIVTNQTIYGGNAIGSYRGSLSVTNATQYKLLLTYSGRCGTNIPWVSYNWGASNCDNWLGASYFAIDSFSGLNGTVNMRIGAQGTSWSTGYGTMEISQSGQITSINSGAGFIVRGIDYMGRDVGLRAVVENGNFQTGYSFTVTLYFQQVPFATATMSRTY